MSPTTAILAYGSLIKDPGAEISQNVSHRIPSVLTPFRVEYARSSSSRNGAPTLVPVENGGGQVEGELLVLKENVGLTEAENMLYRREINKVGRSDKVYDSSRAGENSVIIKRISGTWMVEYGVDVVIYAALRPNLTDHTPKKVAELAVKSALTESGKEHRDGISYIIDALNAGIETPLTNAVVEEILKISKASSLEEAREKLVWRSGSSMPIE